MASDDFSDVRTAFDRASYAAGETISLTVTGQNRHTSAATTTQETVTVTAVVEAAGGSRYTLNAAPLAVTHTTPGEVSLEDVTIVSVTDTDNRLWTFAGRTATAVA